MSTIPHKDDEQALHQYKLAKAVHNETLKNEDQEEKYQELKAARESKKKFQSKQGQEIPVDKDDHNDEAQVPVPVEKKENTMKYKARRPAHIKRRHRITKKRFMKAVDYELMKLILAKAKLENSPLLKDDFNASSLSMETFISARQDMLKLEVIMEALKEGLFDKFGADSKKQDIHIPTEEELLEFEKEKQLVLARIKEKEGETVLENTRQMAKDLGVTRRKAPAENEKIMQDVMKDMRTMLINVEQQLQIEGDGTEDAYTKLVRNLKSPDTSEDEWTLSTSTTTGSYKSWRRNKEEVENKYAAAHKQRKPHWGDGSKHLLIRFIAGVIIFGYWIYYIKQGFTKLMHDIYSEQLQNHDVLPTRYVHMSLDGSFVLIKFYHWFHFIFTLIAPITVVENHTALGVFYGFSIMVHGLVYMFEIGHDQLFEPLPTWGIIMRRSADAILFSGMVVVFFIFHYVNDQIKKSREFHHRKTHRINRVCYAKTLGKFEQRMFAWDWMINHARKRQIKKLAKLYPQIAQVNGHFPLPERKNVKFNLPKELRIFRFRHMFDDVTIRGGWINMEQYQNELFGSNESSSETDEDYLDYYDQTESCNTGRRTSIKRDAPDEGDKEKLERLETEDTYDRDDRETFRDENEPVENINDSTTTLSQQPQPQVSKDTKRSGPEMVELFKAQTAIDTNDPEVNDETKNQVTVVSESDGKNDQDEISQQQVARTSNKSQDEDTKVKISKEIGKSSKDSTGS